MPNALEARERRENECSEVGPKVKIGDSDITCKVDPGSEDVTQSTHSARHLFYRMV